MKKKVRRFSEGDSVREGPHAGISDETRRRALKFAALDNEPETQEAFQKAVHSAGQAEAERPTARTTAPASKATPKAASVSKADTSVTDTGDETERLTRRYPASSKADTSVTDTGDETERLSKRYPAPKAAEPASSSYKGQYSPEAKAARLARSAANAERGGMTPEAEKAVERAGAVASVIPAVRGAGLAAKGVQKAAEAVGRQAAVRKGLASEAQQWGASAPATNRARDIAQDVRGAAREAITQRRTQAEAARKARDEAATQARSMREEARQFGSNLPKSLRERAEEAGSKVAEKAKRMFSRSSPKSNRPRFGESADDAAQAGYKKGGAVSASRRGDGIAQRGKTRGRYL